MLLDKKVILVTGSSTGIGESTARRAVAEGALVMVHGRSAERAKAVAADLGTPRRMWWAMWPIPLSVTKLCRRRWSALGASTAW
jgi:NAD(P)-dependent dehydrogenase (short-subunit alcohol dehydrogenase family)